MSNKLGSSTSGQSAVADFPLASQYGGAPLLGLNGLVVKTHGSSKAVEVKNSILQCIAFKEEKINEKIKEQIGLEDKAAENN